MNCRKHEYVDSGRLSVKGRQNLCLKACLGTCVGVAMADRTAHIGGLIHLLLPESVGSYMPSQPEIYASTGLPLFIETLCDAGARKERLEASVAGGALIGTISEQDISLDIGGRTADIVTDILSREGIAVNQSETGGHHNMVLSLDLYTWNCVIEPLIPQPVHDGGQLRKPSSGDIAQIIARVRPIPQVALRIVRMIADDRYSMEDVSDEIRRDQIITAKVLRLSNSAMTGRKYPVESIDEALLVLGEKKLLRLVVSASLETYFAPLEHGYSFCKGGLYHHAVATARVAEKLSWMTGKSSPAVAYTAGLLHDIGKVVLDHFIALNFPLFYRRTQHEIVSLEDAEIEMLGIGHTEAGWRLANLWSIPQNVAETIRHHHRPENASLDPDLAHIVYLADLIRSRFGVIQDLERISTDSFRSCLSRLGFKTSELPSILDGILGKTLNSDRL